MSDASLLFTLTLLIFICASLLTFGWHKIIVLRHKRKQANRTAQQ